MTYDSSLVVPSKPSTMPVAGNTTGGIRCSSSTRGRGTGEPPSYQWWCQRTLVWPKLFDHWTLCQLLAAKEQVTPGAVAMASPLVAAPSPVPQELQRPCGRMPRASNCRLTWRWLCPFDPSETAARSTQLPRASLLTSTSVVEQGWMLLRCPRTTSSSRMW